MVLDTTKFICLACMFFHVFSFMFVFWDTVNVLCTQHILVCSLHISF